MADVADESPPSLAVLLVEDEPANRALIRAMLARSRIAAAARIQLHEAATLAEARSILAREPIAVVLLDVRLPDGNGLDLATELRDRDGADRPAVIVTSASVLPTERTMALARGADAFLGKPFGVNQLIDVLERHMPS